MSEAAGVVRIEIEDTEPSSEEPIPEVASSTDRPVALLLGLGLVGIALVLTLGLLQPSDGEQTSVGAEREPSSAASDVTASSNPESPTTSRPADRFAFAEPIVPITSTFESVVRHGHDGTAVSYTHLTLPTKA